MKNVLSLVVLALALSGCSLFGQSSIDKTNQMIMDANKERLVEYGRALSACEDNAACQVGVSLAFAGNLGQQQILRPETGLDYLREARLWIDPIDRIVSRLDGSGGVSGDRAASVIRGDGNLVLIGNRASADNGSTAGFSLNPSYAKSWSGYNRNFAGQQPITDEGLQ